MYKMSSDCISIHNPYATLREMIQGHSSSLMSNTVMTPLDDILNCAFCWENDRMVCPQSNLIFSISQQPVRCLCYPEMDPTG